jgi:hypothetical protein
MGPDRTFRCRTVPILPMTLRAAITTLSVRLMPTREHEFLPELVEKRPTLPAQLLERVYPDVLPAFDRARLERKDLAVYKPTEYQADSVVTLRSGGRKVLGVIVEVQRSRDDKKRWSWPVYVAGLRARLQCPVVLLVVCPDRPLGRWCAHPIELGHPEFVLRPLVLGPDEVPLVTDPSEAEDNVELAVLSAVVHAEDDDRAKVFAAVLHALAKIDPERADSYYHGMLPLLSKDARELLEEMMDATAELKSRIARLYHGRGRAEGKAEGKAEGEARAILRLLAVRRIDVTDDARERITSCTDLDQLDVWVTRAATVTRIDDLFA